MRTTSLILSLLILSGGCFFGTTTPHQKNASYVVGGLAMAFGAVLLLGNHIDSGTSDGTISDSGCGDRDGCWSSGGGFGAAGPIAGGMLLGAGALGTVLLLVTPTTPPEATTTVAKPRVAAAVQPR